MALVDLANYDLLDLLGSCAISEEKKGKYLYDYMAAFSNFLSEHVADQLKDEDEEAFEKLLYDPQVTPEAIEQFYKDRIPNYDAFLLADTLVFKKNYLLTFYKRMQMVTQAKRHPSADLWSKIVQEGEADNWNEVARLVKEIEEKHLPVSPPAMPTTETAPPTLPSSSPPPVQS